MLRGPILLSLCCLLSALHHHPADTLSESPADVSLAEVIEGSWRHSANHSKDASTAASADANSHVGQRKASVSWTCFAHHLLEFGSLGAMIGMCVLISFVCCMGICSSGQPKNATSLFSIYTGTFIMIGLVILAAVATCVGLVIWKLHGRLELVHIPKTAGTSIEKSGEEVGIRWSGKAFAFIGRQRMSDGEYCNRYHVPPHLLNNLINPYWAATTFCVVRHPYDRIVSEYEHLLTAPYAEDVSTNSGLREYPECSNEGLNSFVETTMSSYQAGRMYLNDCHHVPQVEYLRDEASGRVGCQYVLDMDDLETNFDNLMSVHGYDITLTESIAQQSSNYCPTISAANLTQRSKDLLREVYHDDFQQLNFVAY